jgi:hypothetical protein
MVVLAQREREAALRHCFTVKLTITVSHAM